MAEDETRGRRRDAKRNEEAILEAAAAVFVEAGIQAPVRAVAERAGVGMGTLYRHFPTRADLVVALYQHQVDAAAAAGPTLLRESPSPAAALHAWVSLFVEFLVTKHGLADALQGDPERFGALHQSLTDRLVPVCADLLHAAAPHGAPVEAYAFLRGIGNLCIGGTAPGYEPERLAHLLVDGALASSGS